MKKRSNPEKTSRNNPEWTRAMLAKAISLRLSPDTLARWKATGPGWQTRMAKVLRESV